MKDEPTCCMRKSQWTRTCSIHLGARPRSDEALQIVSGCSAPLACFSRDGRPHSRWSSRPAAFTHFETTSRRTKDHCQTPHGFCTVFVDPVLHEGNCDVIGFRRAKRHYLGSLREPVGDHDDHVVSLLCGVKGSQQINTDKLQRSLRGERIEWAVASPLSLIHI